MAANYCPQCSKMVSFDTEVEPEEQTEPEIGDVVGDTLMISAQVRVANACEQCSTELTDYTADLEAEFEMPEGHTEHTVELGDAEWERGERTQTTAKNRKTGKDVRIKRARYMKRFYSVTGRVPVNCSCGEHLGDAELTTEWQASSMDVLN